MGTIPFLLTAWVIHVIVAAVVVTPIAVVARKRVHWRSRDLLALLVPFCVWIVVMVSDISSHSKSLSNLVVEPGILAVVLALGALARVAASTSVPDKMASTAALVGLCVAAAGVFWLVPALPE